MVARDVETQRVLHPMKFLIAVIDDCNESDRAVLELRRRVAPPEEVRMFHGNHAAKHLESTGMRLDQLEHALGYLQELLMIEGSILGEYGEHGTAGCHILLIDVHRDDRINELIRALATTQAYKILLLACSPIAALRPSVPSRTRPEIGVNDHG